MTYEIYRYIFIGGAALAGLMLLIAVILFFTLRIPAVIGDLSGSTARKAIEDIRNQNAVTGNKTYKSSKVNRERGRITDKISPSGKLIQPLVNDHGAAMLTEKISTSRLNAEAEESFTTTVLQYTDTNETTILSAPTEESGATTVLMENQVPFEIIYEITLIHTSELIS